MRRLGLLCLVSAVLASVAAPAAGARRPPVTAGMPTVFDAVEATGAYGERARRRSLRELRYLGADVVRVIVYWRDVVPGPTKARRPRHFNPRDPDDYARLGALDRTLRDAHRLGLKVMLVPTGRFPDGRVPRWAKARPRGRSKKPSAPAFGAFVQGLARRYRGGYDPDGRKGPLRPIPRAAFFSLWNEPNSGAFLRPVDEGPEIYRRLVLAGVRGLKRARWKGTVLAGEASAGGDNQTPPVEFMRRVLCMPPGFGGPPACRPLPISGWSQHPYSLGLAPWEAPRDPGGVSIGSLGRLTGPMSKAIAFGALPTGSGLWLTEYGYETEPDPKGISPDRQAEYNAIGERLAGESPLVRSFAQYLLRDDPPGKRGDFPSFETGLRRHHGARKPAWSAFRTPLAVRLAGGRALIWGRIRPARGAVSVEVAARDPGRAESVVAVLRTDPRGYFELDAGAAPDRQWRVRALGVAAPWIDGFDYP